MKKLSFIALAVAGVLGSTAAMAQEAAAPKVSAADGTVEIRGKVVDQTCEVASDYKNLVVILDTVGKNKLASQGQVASPKPFEIKVTNCKAPADGANTVFASFSPVSLDHIDAANAGTLKNRAVTAEAYTAAENVNVQLLTADDQPIRLNAATATNPGEAHPLAAQGNKFNYEAADTFVVTGKKVNENNGTPVLGKKVIGGETVYGQLAINDNPGVAIKEGENTMTYKAQYYATGEATPGLVEAFVTYNISYK